MGCEDGTLIIYDINNNFTQIKDQPSYILSLEFSKDSKYLFTWVDGNAFIYDVYNNFKLLKMLDDPFSNFSVPDFSYNNKYLVTWEVIYDVTDNFNKIKEIFDHKFKTISVAFISDNKYLYTGS